MFALVLVTQFLVDVVPFQIGTTPPSVVAVAAVPTQSRHGQLLFVRQLLVAVVIDLEILRATTFFVVALILIFPDAAGILAVAAVAVVLAAGVLDVENSNEPSC